MNALGNHGEFVCNPVSLHAPGNHGGCASLCVHMHFIRLTADASSYIVALRTSLFHDGPCVRNAAILNKVPLVSWMKYIYIYTYIYAGLHTNSLWSPRVRTHISKY